MKEMSDQKTDAHEESVARLVEKLFLDPSLIGRERPEEISYLLHAFWDNYGDYTLCMNKFICQDMCIMAERPTQASHLWHKTYSLGPTRILSELTFILTSKIMVIGNAERHWKQIKKVKSGQSNNTINLKDNKQFFCFSAYTQIRARLRQRMICSSGKLWNDDDLRGVKMDDFCGQILNPLDNNQSDANGETNSNFEVRIFCAWVETWETNKIGPNGDAILEASILREYGSLKWLDPGNGFCLKIAHPNRMNFNKQWGNK